MSTPLWSHTPTTFHGSTRPRGRIRNGSSPTAISTGDRTSSGSRISAVPTRSPRSATPSSRAVTSTSCRFRHATRSPGRPADGSPSARCGTTGSGRTGTTTTGSLRITSRGSAIRSACFTCPTGRAIRSAIRRFAQCTVIGSGSSDRSSFPCGVIVTKTVSPALNFPSSSRIASGSMISFWSARLSGRAPNAGS